MPGTARLLIDSERTLRKWNGLLMPLRCRVLRCLPAQALRFGEVAFLCACRGQDQEPEEDRRDAPFMQPTPALALHSRPPLQETAIALDLLVKKIPRANPQRPQPQPWP